MLLALVFALVLLGISVNVVAWFLDVIVDVMYPTRVEDR
jgi:hypothetical protein